MIPGSSPSPCTRIRSHGVFMCLLSGLRNVSGLAESEQPPSNQHICVYMHRIDGS